MQPYVWQADRAIQPFVNAAAEDADTVGLLLSGSRSAGLADAESDYDLYRVVSDEAYDRRHEQGQPPKVTLPASAGRASVELMYTCPRRLAELAAQPGWWTAGYATAQVLLDKTGQIAPLLAAMRTLPDDRARADAAAWFDAYLNAFYRSLKAWRRGDELGGRLQAAESAMHLVRTLFPLERRWPPYHDRLAHQLETLAGQGWPAGYLREALLDLLRTGAPGRQQALEAQVEALLRARGFGHVVDAWDGEIERVKAFQWSDDGAAQ